MKASGSLSSIVQSAAGMWSRAMRGSRILLILILAAFCCSSLSAQPPAEEEALEVPAEGLSQRQALERVRARFPGNIISVNEVNHDGRIRFRFRIDNEGNIYTVYVDRATGAITRE
ncbi:MAG: PepSY domain-containing protein [Pseudohongiella sp.]|nr:PepSY domain-containing protein [Pseudohongiella sp.]MDO9521778.1 PepSY domain-containing protein [Pseudohongiella sp.]